MRGNACRRGVTCASESSIWLQSYLDSKLYKPSRTACCGIALAGLFGGKSKEHAIFQTIQLRPPQYSTSLESLREQDIGFGLLLLYRDIVGDVHSTRLC